jgi:hypothetical protein
MNSTQLAAWAREGVANVAQVFDEKRCARPAIGERSSLTRRLHAELHCATSRRRQKRVWRNLINSK